MPTFALIAEGITDQVILDRIIDLTCHPTDDEDFEVNYVQPLRDATDASNNIFGGWELVLEFCKLRFDDALQTNDYVVIQIDTDVGDHVNFGVSLTEGGVDRDFRDLLLDVKKVIVQAIGEEAFRRAEERVLFAIAVHSIESWLLLLLFKKDNPKSSFERLQRELRRKDDVILTKDATCYRAMARRIKSRNLIEARRLDSSLKVFLDDLADVCMKRQ